MVCLVFIHQINTSALVNELFQIEKNVYSKHSFEIFVDETQSQIQASKLLIYAVYVGSESISI